MDSFPKPPVPLTHLCMQCSKPTELTWDGKCRECAGVDVQNPPPVSDQLKMYNRHSGARQFPLFAGEADYILDCLSCFSVEHAERVPMFHNELWSRLRAFSGRPT